MKNILTVAGMILALTLAPNLLRAASQAAIPAGTRIDVELTSPLSTSANQDGDPFTAKVEDPIFAGGQEVIHVGSTLHGHVTFVKPPGRVKGKAEMRLVADNIVTKDGKEYSFKGQLADNNSGDVKVKGSEGTVQGAGKSAKRGAEETGIGAAAGAGVGALVRVIHTLAKHHKNLVLHPGTELTFVLS